MAPTLTRRQILGLGGLALGAAAFGTWRELQAAPAAAPATGLKLPPRGDRRLVLISDLNSSYGSTTYIPEVGRGIALIPSMRADLVVCAGDMVAGQKASLSTSRLQAMWAGFDRQVLRPLRRAGLPFLPAMGNHDASSSRVGGRYSFERERQEASRFWRGQQRNLGLTFLDASGFPFFYSVLQDDLFLLVLDASSAQIPAEQLRWAERSLASAAARGAQRRLVMGHLPLLGVAQGRDTAGNVVARDRELRQILERAQVEAYISGHQHAYYPGRAGQLDLIQLGALGSGPRRLLGQRTAPFQTLTVLDYDWSSGRRRDSTVNMRTLQAVDPQRLPPRLSDRRGRAQTRRSSATGG
ncbi:metallophosphoesterase [Synechococcus sp. BSF8S]|uniref:metallophosphoesterase family protein n=1 Tax=unclassified Synechococcus TaxID=2626047 RepID=UPI0016243FC1|nr:MULTISPECIES: metallophosphoesterase [unclassified Synechococcus]MBC1260774.1 metallophosphoesterase [Synechococcus sp. BSF8S]MBC1263450.1 metallophosphoesterase [Synechococcus sp. BSA11S]